MVSLQLDPEYGWVLLAAVATYSIEKWMVSYKIVIRHLFSDKTNQRQIEFQAIKVGGQRKALGVPYPEMYSEKQPLFNCYQRAHQVLSL